MAELEVISRPPELEVISRPEQPEGPPPGFPFGLGGKGELGAGPPEKQRIDEAQKKEEEQRLSTLSNAVGGEFDPEGRVDFFTSADLARSGGEQALNEQLRKFKSKFPEGEMRFVRVGEEVVPIARTNKEEPFRQLSGAGEAFGVFVSEPVAGGVAGSFGGPVGTVAGVMAGKMAQSEVERFRGFEEDPRMQVAGSGLREGLVESLVDVVTRGTLGRFISSGDLAQRQLDALNAGRAEGLPALAKGQIAKSPLVRAMFTQASGTSAVGQELVSRQRGALKGRLESLSADDLSGVSDKNLESVLVAQNNKLSETMTPTGITKDKAGKALNEGLQEYEIAGREWVTRKYNTAKETAKGDIVFDPSAAKKTARLVKEGTPVKLRPRTNKQGERVVTRRGKSEKTRTRGEGALTSEIRDVIGLIEKLPDEVSTIASRRGEVSGFEQLKSIRTRLFNLMRSDDGDTRASAKRLWKSITNVMENPRAPEAGETFVKQWKAASRAHRLLENRLEQSFVARSLKTDELGLLADKYIAPGRFLELQQFKRLIPRDNWEVFRNRFKEDILLDPQAGLRKLNRFATDKQTLRLLVSEEEERQLREYAKLASRFDSSEIRAVFEQNLSRGERALRLANEGSVEDLRNTIDLAGGKNSDLAVSTRSGVYQKLLNDFTSEDQFGREVMDVIGLRERIRQLKKSGRLEPLFRKKDWDTFENIRAYTSIVGQSIDVGGLIQRGEIASGTTDVFRPQRMQRAAQLIGRNEVVASVLARPGSRAIKQMEASVDIPIDERRLRAAVIAATTALQEAEGTQVGGPF